MDIQVAITALINGKSLSKKYMSSVMRQIMSHRAIDAQIEAFLIALGIKGETIDEISSAAQVIPDFS